MSVAIGAADRAVIAGLSRAEVELTTAALKQFMVYSRWLGLKNRYQKQVVERLKSDVPLTRDRSRNLAQYIAASGTLHCLDSWSYLGRALASLLRGDTHRALHLAYYAELRAAVSLLATEGIGILDKQHFVIDQANSTRKLTYGHGTHVAAWTALEFWSAQPGSGSLFAELIQPEGTKLEEWFHPHGGTATLAAQAKIWFMQWGMDLSLAAKDREARNESSYRPDGIPTVCTIDSGAIVDFVADLWRILEPSSASTFQIVDRHILRIALEAHFTGRHGAPATRSNPDFVSLIETTLAAQSLEDSSYLSDFLLRKSDVADATVFKRARDAPNQGAVDIFAIVSRAVLLLRVATGSVADQLQTATLDKAALKFWWETVGETRGFWKPGSFPSELTDLWQDIADALAEVEADKALDSDAFSTAFDVRSSETLGSDLLCSSERVPLWSLFRS